MKDKQTIFMRLIFVVLTIVSLFLLLESPISLKVDNTQKMARTVLNQVCKKGRPSNLQAAAKMVKGSSLEKVLLSALPKRFTVQASYADVYSLSRTYRRQGKLSVTDLGLTQKNSLEAVLNQALVNEINYKLREEAGQVSNVISIYQYSVILIIMLYLLAAILFILGRLWAIVPLLLGSGGSFTALWYLCRAFNDALQAKVYHGITFSLAMGIWLGLIIALLLSIAWPLVLRFFKRRHINHA